ncbi:hypothetical protein [Mycolicibacterium sp.]|uniref:hypothetical protein n=1 Tax=Mycolicibacterium sp. TaxID=2320850 RepID=UPI00355CE66E
MTALVASSACTAPPDDDPFPWAPPPELTVPQSTAAAPAGLPEVSEIPRTAVPPLPQVELDRSFAAFSAAQPGTVAVSVAGAAAVQSFGDEPEVVAWSTIKAALSIAAMRADPAAARPLMVPAITVSDNDAGARLWALLGPPARASAAVQDVLAEGRAPASVPTTAIRPPYSPFGQTRWPGTHAATFAARLPCIRDAEPVLEQMRRLAPEQSWGLARDQEVAAKGGWGPEPNGDYLVRQIAVLPVQNGYVGVSLVAAAEDKKLSTGIAMVDRLADWVRQHRAALTAEPLRSCT